jgi:hypothetical protein
VGVPLWGLGPEHCVLDKHAGLRVAGPQKR